MEEVLSEFSTSVFLLIRWRCLAALPWLVAAAFGVSLSAQVRPGQRKPAAPVEVNHTRAACQQQSGRLLDISGYGDALRGATAISRLQFQNGLAAIPGLSNAQRTQVVGAFARAFDPNRLRVRIRANLVSRCDPATYQAVLTGLGSPLGRRMRAWEVAAGTPEGARAVQSYLSHSAEQPPTPDRLALIQKLETSRHELDFLQGLLVVMAKEAAIGFGSTPPSDADIGRSLELNLPMAEKIILLREAAVYRHAPDQDLAQYASLWSSAPFQRFSRILAASFDAAFGTSVREAAQAVRPLIVAHGAGPANQGG
jgi:hypothetical protein